MRRRRYSVGALLICWLVLAGCSSYQPPSPDAPPTDRAAVDRGGPAPIGPPPAGMVAEAVAELPVRVAGVRTVDFRERRVSGTAGMSLPESAYLLGATFALDRETTLRATRLEPISEIRVTVRAYDGNGDHIASVRRVAVRATHRETRVDHGWRWVDLSMLGFASRIEVEVVATQPRGPTDNLGTAGDRSEREEPSEPGQPPSILVDRLAVTDSRPVADEYFTVAVVPDTQKYSESYPEIFLAQTRYLRAVAAEERIAFVSHLGDVVENGENEAEWQRADRAMAELDGVVPYGIVIGNHDFFDEFGDPFAGSPFFRKYFPDERFAPYRWFGEFSEDGLSSYQVIDADELQLLFLHLSVDTPPATLEWAREVLRRYPDRAVVVTTHVYLRENGRIPKPYLWGSGNDSWNGISSEEFFQTFIAEEPQVFMVLCGHVSAEKLQISRNAGGMPVYELLQDYQNRESGGEGFLRLLKFYPHRNEVRAITYSPWLREYEVDADSHFTFALDFERLSALPARTVVPPGRASD